MIKNIKIKLLALDVDGTLTDGGIYMTESGDQFKKFNAKDGTGIRYLLKNGIQVGLISASMKQRIVYERAELLGIPYCYVGDEDKAIVLDRWLQELNISAEQVAFVGDDVNDSSIIKKVGLSACPADAVDAIKKIVDVVLTKTGGEACVREFIDTYLADIS